MIIIMITINTITSDPNTIIYSKSACAIPRECDIDADNWEKKFWLVSAVPFVTVPLGF